MSKKTKHPSVCFCQLAPQRAGITLLASPLTLLGKLYEPSNKGRRKQVGDHLLWIMPRLPVEFSCSCSITINKFGGTSSG
eukprot:5502212-Pyramimonas_sp.AAC.1